MLTPVILIILCSIVLCGAESHPGHQCSPESSSFLSFTNDLNSVEFPIVGSFIALSCCVQGFTSVTWTRSGNMSVNSSTFYVSPSDPRQLVSKYVRIGDRGNYTCTARNNTHSLTHIFRLRVFVSDQYNGLPLTAGRPIDQWAKIGEKAEFRCSFFIGFGKMRQLNSEVYWVRNLSDIQFAERANHSTERLVNYTSNGEIVSTYLTIPHVDEKDYGEYFCVANNGIGGLNISVRLHPGIDPEMKYRNSQTASLAMLAAGVLMTLVITSAYISNRTKIHLFLKDRCAPLEDDKGAARHDVFVCYSSSDSSELVLGWLVPILEQNFGYTCFAFERDMDPGEWMPEVFAAKIRESRRFLLVLSRGLLRDSLCRLACQLAVQEALTPGHELRLVCALPPAPLRQELLEEVDAAGTLGLVLSVAPKATLPSQERATDSDDIKFWNQLRLRLPPRRPEARPLIYRRLNTTQV